MTGAVNPNHSHSQDALQHPWWETAVLYQIYPLTFADGDGNGVGDIRGIIERLDYLRSDNDDECLDVDALWLSPVNRSPMKDNGYDVSDYCDIDPTFGTLDDFKELVKAAHARNIKIIMDLVINHTSSEHAWFQESSSSRTNDKNDWYIWHDPGYTGKEPNNWLSYFGGTAWTYCEKRQQYYYHAFNKNQPDLNWRNPKVRRAIHDVVRFWLDIGVDGFRLDASSVYAKDKYCRDNPMKFGANHTNPYDNQHHLYDKDLPENHAIIRGIRKVMDEYGDRLLIGETFIDSGIYDSNLFYGVNNDELHLPFTFEFPFSPWYPGYLQREIQKKEILTPENAWPTYFLDNHDIPRHLVRWNECSLCNDSQQIARAAATILLTLRGTPVLYYGQEIGMVDHDSIPPEKLRDAVFEDVKQAENDLESRDGVRTPMQWNSGVHAGFCDNPDAELWLPINPNYTDVNVASELADKNSVLSFYRALLRVRKYQSKALRYGRWRTLIHYPYEHLAYVREWEDETVLVMINFGNIEQACHLDIQIDRQGWTVLLTNSQKLQIGETIDVPSMFKPFDIFVLQKFSQDSPVPLDEAIQQQDLSRV